MRALRPALPRCALTMLVLPGPPPDAVAVGLTGDVVRLQANRRKQRVGESSARGGSLTTAKSARSPGSGARLRRSDDFKVAIAAMKHITRRPSALQGARADSSGKLLPDSHGFWQSSGEIILPVPAGISLQLFLTAPTALRLSQDKLPVVLAVPA